jgi:hypothetical protein
MVLGTFQTWLTDFYALELAYDVDDFLITDRRLASVFDHGGREADEKLLIAEENGEAEVCLYLQQELVDRLASNDPTTGINERNLADFWTAFEGVSHFTYYAFSASNDRAVTLLEMELQAEVDKFVATTMLLRDQGERPPEGLHHWLFSSAKFDRRLTASEQERYGRANHYAGKYCMKLWPMLSKGLAGADLRHELRYFYRLPRGPKIAHIDAI